MTIENVSSHSDIAVAFLLGLTWKLMIRLVSRVLAPGLLEWHIVRGLTPPGSPEEVPLHSKRQLLP